MQVIELRCPHCAAKLRLRDQSYIGRVVHCPDCAQPVSFARNAAGTVEAAPAAVEPQPKATGRAASASTGTLHPVNGEPGAVPAVAPGRWRSLTPAKIAWPAAGVLMLSLALAAWLTRPAREQRATEVTVPGRPVLSPAPGIPPVPDAPSAASPAAELPPLNLQPLIELLAADRDRHGRFPAEHTQARALPEPERLGWQAVLAAANDPTGPQPQWDRPVLDPLNARFVRRRMPVFLNPLLPEAAVDGLPATHFVGVAGVGADAAQLEPSHPRAGIFGEGRDTRPGDVRDGLSNTLMVLGAAGRPAPWAAGGARTMRPLAREPYVNGPDGFGTGQPDGMYALLADGSTRFLSHDVDPLVLRRMAAMADGQPLDPAVRGDPGDAPPVAAPPTAAPAAVKPEDEPLRSQPILPIVSPDRVLPPPPSYDVERALAQPIVRYSQVRPVPFGELLVQMQELAGVPVCLEPAAEATREQTVTLELHNTTVGAILRALAERVGLRVETGTDFGVRLTPADR